MGDGEESQNFIITWSNKPSTLENLGQTHLGSVLRSVKYYRGSGEFAD